MNVCCCVHDHLKPFTRQCQKQQNVHRISSNNLSQCCVDLPYYNDEYETLELLRFIIHGDKRATLTQTQSDNLQIFYQPSEWRKKQTFLVKVFDNAQIIRICSKSSNDWLGSQKSFLLAIQNKYLNVATKG